MTAVHTGGTWLVASQLEGRPVTLDEVYPCRCEDVDTDPPQWKVERARRTGEQVHRCDPYQKKGTEQWRNRCPCWGQPADGKPDGCCSQHERNPRYLVTVEGITYTDPAGATTQSDTPDDTPPRPPIDDNYPEWAIPVPPPAQFPPTPDYLGHALGLPPEDQPLAPYARRWSAEEITCPCRTPWDGLKKGFGFHCANCHVNFRSVSVAQMHGGWLKPCKDPSSIVDMGPGPTTGTPLLRLSYSDSGHEVWG